MRTFALSVLALAFGIVGLPLTACSNSADDCNATATCGNAANAGSAGKAGGGAGNDGGNGAGGTPSTGGSQSGGSTGEAGNGGGGPGDCKGNLSEDAACWTTDELGVFVSVDAGDDEAGNGTRAAPFASISKGIASAAGKNVYVCRGENEDAYAEQLIIDGATVDNVHVYAGFDCADWSYSAARTVDVKSPLPIALRIKDLKQGAVIENIRFFAAPGTEADLSSYGAFITNSKKVALRRVELTAGDGMKGADGAPGTKGADGEEAGAPPAGSKACEADESKVSGGKWLAASVCGTRGGVGGTGEKSIATADSGNAGIPTENVDPLANIDNGGSGEGAVVASLDGKSGASGNAGAVGKVAASKGKFSLEGFSVASGNAGTAGYAGQGGGGGGAAKGSAACYGASGGAGGMGGCGGTPGAGASGGGASIGLLSWSSDITLTSCNVTSGVGGAGGVGGKGGGGGSGFTGGAGGNASPGDGLTKSGGAGGPGGPGGNGGSGSGGTGGPSYALAFSGTKPVYTDGDTSLIAGMGGEPGKGGVVASVAAPDGVVGDSAGELEIK